MEMTTQTEKLVLVGCNLCGTGNNRFLFDTYDRNIGRENRFRMVQCCSCGLVFLNPRPTQESFHQHYNDSYYPYQVPQGTVRASEIRVKKLPQTKIKKALHDPKSFLGWAYLNYLAYSRGDFHRIKKIFPRQTRLLDIGCGTGQFILSALRYGWSVQGVEFMPQACEKAKSLGLSVFQGTLEQAHFPDKSFDLVRMSHVFEHLPDPVGTLKEIDRILSDRGLVLITVPNFGGMLGRLFKKGWWCVDSPRHFYLYTPRTLRAIAEKSGFEVVFQRTATGKDGVVASLECWMETRRPASEKKFEFSSGALKNLIQKGTLPLCRLADWIGFGDGLEMTLKKR